MVFNDATAFDKFIESGSYFYAGAQGTAATTTGTNQASGPPVKSYAHAAGLYGGASIGGLGILIKEKPMKRRMGRMRPLWTSSMESFLSLQAGSNFRKT